MTKSFFPHFVIKKICQSVEYANTFFFPERAQSAYRCCKMNQSMKNAVNHEGQEMKISWICICDKEDVWHLQTNLDHSQNDTTAQVITF